MRILSDQRIPLQDLPFLILMTDAARLADPTAAIARLPRGSAVIFRDYQAADRWQQARRLRHITRARGVRFLVAGDARLACQIAADGLHLPEAASRSAPRRWQRWRRRGWLVTAAAHDFRAIRRAVNLDVDAVLLSPVFSTASHPQAAPLGLVRFARISLTSPLPVYALGGITAQVIGRIGLSNAIGVAGITGIPAIAASGRRWWRRSARLGQASSS